MIVIRYTGQGWLAFVLFMVVGAGCITIVSQFGLRDDAMLIAFAVLYVLIGTPVHWRIGTAFNSPRRAPGGPPRQVHMFGAMPMEYWAVWYPVIALVIAGILVVKNGYTGGAWAIGIGTLVGLAVYARLARKHWDRKHPPAAQEGQLLFGPPPPGQDGRAATRRQLAEARGWRYREQAPEIRMRWHDAYGAEADRIAPKRVLAGELDGMPFTVFDTIEKIGRLADRRESLRTVCMVHLPVALPDARLRGRLADEEQYGPLPPVAAEPPWNCDILPRVSALELIESGDGQAPPMAAESDLPGFSDALITEAVRWETIARKVPGWRIHGRDLLFVGLPGAEACLSNHEAMAVVAGLVAIARRLPADVLDRHGQPPTTGLPLADPAEARHA